MESELNKNKRPPISFLIVASIVMVVAVAILAIALTDMFPGNPLQEYKTVIVFGFLAVGGFVREAWKRYQK